MNYAAIISLIGVCCSAFAAWLGYRNGLKKDGNAEGSLHTDVRHIRTSVDDLKLEQRNFISLHYDLAERVAKVETSDKSAHHRIDGIEEKLDKIQGGN